MLVVGGHCSGGKNYPLERWVILRDKAQSAPFIYEIGRDIRNIK